MGVCQSLEEQQMKVKSRAIDREIIRGHIASEKTVKLLLLGKHLFIFDRFFSY
jgi:hypothetical protein